MVEEVSITFGMYVSSTCTGSAVQTTVTTPETKALDQCVAYVSANGQFSGFEVLTCASPGMITSTKYTDSECTVGDEVNSDETMVLGACENRGQAYVMTDWGTEVCQHQAEMCSETDIMNMMALLTPSCQATLLTALDPSNFEADVTEEECTCLLSVSEENAAQFECRYNPDISKTMYDLYQECAAAATAACVDNDATAVALAAQQGETITGCADAVTWCGVVPGANQICPLTCGMCTTTTTTAAPCVDNHATAIALAAAQGQTITGCADAVTWCGVVPGANEICPLTCGICTTPTTTAPCIDDDATAIFVAAQQGQTITGCGDAASWCGVVPGVNEICPVTCNNCPSASSTTTTEPIPEPCDRANAVVGVDDSTAIITSPPQFGVWYDIRATAVTAEPYEGCTAVTNDVSGKIAVVSRGTCSFITKILNAQDAGAVGVVILNNDGGNNLWSMGCSGAQCNSMAIPALFLNHAEVAIFNTVFSEDLELHFGCGSDYGLPDEITRCSDEVFYALIIGIQNSEDSDCAQVLQDAIEGVSNQGLFSAEECDCYNRVTTEKFLEYTGGVDPDSCGPGSGGTFTEERDYCVNKFYSTTASAETDCAALEGDEDAYIACLQARVNGLEDDIEAIRNAINNQVETCQQLETIASNAVCGTN